MLTCAHELEWDAAHERGGQSLHTLALALTPYLYPLPLPLPVPLPPALALTQP